MIQYIYCLLLIGAMSTDGKSLPYEDIDVVPIQTNSILHPDAHAIEREKFNIFSVGEMISPLMKTILSNETIKAVLSDPMVQGVLLNPTVQSVLNNPIVRSILDNDQFQGMGMFQTIVANLPRTQVSTSPIMSLVTTPRTNAAPQNKMANNILPAVPVNQNVQRKPSFINMLLTGIDEILKVLQIQIERRYAQRRSVIG